jgi:hypothetical protein
LSWLTLRSTRALSEAELTSMPAARRMPGVRFPVVTLPATCVPDPPCTLMPWNLFDLDTDEVTELTTYPANGCRSTRCGSRPGDPVAVPPWSLMPYDAESVTVTSRTTEFLEASRKTDPPWWRIVKPHGDPVSVADQEPVLPHAHRERPQLRRRPAQVDVQRVGRRVEGPAVGRRPSCARGPGRVLPLNTRDTAGVAPSSVDQAAAGGGPGRGGEAVGAHDLADGLDARNPHPLGAVTCSR